MFNNRMLLYIIKYLLLVFFMLSAFRFIYKDFDSDKNTGSFTNSISIQTNSKIDNNFIEYLYDNNINIQSFPFKGPLNYTSQINNNLIYPNKENYKIENLLLSEHNSGVYFVDLRYSTININTLIYDMNNKFNIDTKLDEETNNYTFNPLERLKFFPLTELHHYLLFTICFLIVYYSKMKREVIIKFINGYTLKQMYIKDLKLNTTLVLIVITTTFIACTLFYKYLSYSTILMYLFLLIFIIILEYLFILIINFLALKSSDKRKETSSNKLLFIMKILVVIVSTSMLYNVSGGFDFSFKLISSELKSTVYLLENKELMDDYYFGSGLVGTIDTEPNTEKNLLKHGALYFTSSTMWTYLPSFETNEELLLVNKNYTNKYYPNFEQYSLIAPIENKEDIEYACVNYEFYDKEYVCSNKKYIEKNYTIKSLDISKLKDIKNPIVINMKNEPRVTSQTILPIDTYKNLSSYEVGFNSSETQGFQFKNYNELLKSHISFFIRETSRFILSTFKLLFILFVLNLFYIDLYFEKNKYEQLSNLICGNNSSKFIIEMSKNILITYVALLLVIKIKAKIHHYTSGYNGYIYFLLILLTLLFVLYKKNKANTKQFFSKR